MFVALVALFCATMANQPVAGDRYASGNNTDRAAALQFLQLYDAPATLMITKMAHARWNYWTNITEETKQAQLVTEMELAEFNKAAWETATSYAWKEFVDDPLTYRAFRLLSDLGSAALPDEKYLKLKGLIANMTQVFQNTKVCNRSLTCDIPTMKLTPDILSIMKFSNNYDILALSWQGWRDTIGTALKEQYLEYAELKNEAARLNGFSDAGDAWRGPYESDTLQEDLENIWNDVKPFYMNLHAYTRKKLMEVYPGKIKPDGPIPAHILGEMYAAYWSPLYKILQPYPDEPAMNVTSLMLEKNITVFHMVALAEDFFTSLGLLPMTPEFWNNSIFEQPEDRNVLCQPVSSNFHDGKDYRMSMCAEVNEEYLLAIHHEMGHIEYFMQYASQPKIFRTGANPGFHEAIGDTIALSVSTPTHWRNIGLLNEVKDSESADINYLMQIALDKAAFLPFGYALETWRWNLFSGDIPREVLNTKWWEMRLKYQGVCPPVQRTEEYLDPLGMLHVVSDYSYMRYFVSYILQFQLHRALCKEAGHTGPLHKCDIYGNTNVGKLLSDALKLGNSKPWPEVMLTITKNETDRIDASGFLEYFEPLSNWLNTQNANETIGWKSADPTICP